MLRLNLTNEPTWMDFGDGVRLLMRPADMDLMAEAEDDPAVSSLRAEVPKGEKPTPEQAQAIAVAMSDAMLRLAVLEWEGIGDQHGNPIEPSPQAVDALMRIPRFFIQAQAEYLAPAMTLASEGNGSARGQNGTSAQVPATANTARRAAKPAQTAKTPRKR